VEDEGAGVHPVVDNADSLRFKRMGGEEIFRDDPRDRHDLVDRVIDPAVEGVAFGLARADMLYEDQRPPAPEIDGRGDVPKIAGVMGVQQLHPSFPDLAEEAERSGHIQITGRGERYNG